MEFNKVKAKRAFKIGAAFHMEWFNGESNKWINPRDDRKPRYVAVIRSNAVVFTTVGGKDKSAIDWTAENPEGRGSWLFFDGGKKQRIGIEENGTITFFQKRADDPDFLPYIRYVPA